MKLAPLVASLAILSLPALAPVSAQDMSDRDLSLQMSRYDQVIGRLQEQITSLQSDIRVLQRQNDVLSKEAGAAQQHASAVSDQMQNLKNVEFGNLQAQQKQLTEKIVGQAQVYDWGSGQRDCSELGVKHQQIKTTTSPDGLKSVRFLCFDGRVLHLGTEMNVVGNQ